MFFLVIRNSSKKRRIGGAALINFFVPDAALINLFCPKCGAYSRAALINFFVPDAALIRGRRLIEGGAYSSKYGRLLPIYIHSLLKFEPLLNLTEM